MGKTIVVNEAQVKAAELFREALDGDLHARNVLSEGISTGDLPPTLLTPTLQKIALQDYSDVELTWKQWADRLVLNDFGDSLPYWNFQWGDEDVPDSTAGDAFVTGGLPRVPEYGEYEVLRFQAAQETLKMKKNGIQIKFSWESLVNTRNFDMLRRVAVEFGKRAAATEEIEATKMLVRAGGGVNTDNWNAANGNIVTGNPALSIDSLEAAFEQIATQTFNGRPVVPASSYALVVPPALELTAKKIQSITSIEEIAGVGTDTETRYVSGNPVGSKFEVVVASYLPVVAGSGQSAAWWLIPKPGTTPNPSVVNCFLSGYETPQIFVKSNTTSAPGEGDYLDDSYSTKTRYPVTGNFLRPEGTIMSDGTGS